MNRYDFDKGLADVERLEVLIASPLLHVLGRDLPAYGTSTKPSAAEPAALLVVGAATLICGSDRAADRELKAHWPRLHAAFVAAGYRVPAAPLRSQHFRDYRDGFLGGALPDSWKQTARTMFVELALSLGLFPENDEPWIRPHLDGIVTADGTWIAAATDVRDMTTSRSRTGTPRVAVDADRKSGDRTGGETERPVKGTGVKGIAKSKRKQRGWGYMFCITSVRGGAPRLRVVLDVAHAPNSAELDVVIPTVRRLREYLGDRFRCLVYDGAMAGVHHRKIRRLGVLSVNKPKGLRNPKLWSRYRGERVGVGAKVLEVANDCEHRHLLTVTDGLFWELTETVVGGYVRHRVPEVTDIRRFEVGPTSDDGFRWEMDVTVRCERGDHIITFDPNATIKCATGAALRKSAHGPLTYNAELTLSQQLRMLQPNEDNFAPVFGRRNDSETGNKNLKMDYDLGDRARSYTVERVDTDLWIYSLLTNALAWAEHGGRH
ncbi:hypothetical protein [Dermatobacter hominis]|uniref:hypothetical protein n=1 Tax=Dermatobacter hominis TaxID=2884263 RepID=UPI001D0FA098|nr:hypothetical protein [Dermatobacter hominis]UDY34026.1 hypothetical protein LH044_11790 [Dermatobacter hominis]